MIDAEAVLTDYLAGATGTRVVGETPNSIKTAWVHLVLLDAPEVNPNGSDHFTSNLVQLSCYAGATGGQEEAQTLAATVRGALRALAGRTSGGAACTCVEVVGHARVPDTSLEPARQRYILTAQVYLHPLP